jgi:hypothetical protein
MPQRVGLSLLNPAGNTVILQYSGVSLNTALNQGQQFSGASVPVNTFGTMSMLGRVINAKPSCSSCGK